MLPEDTKQRKEAAFNNSVQAQQTSISDHFDPLCKDIIPYSDQAFEAAAIEWFVDTNQVHDFVLVHFLCQSKSSVL